MEIRTSVKTSHRPTLAEGPGDMEPSAALFEMALQRVLESLPALCAVFDPDTDALVLANPAFRMEFGLLPASRSAFEERFEPVAADSSATGLSPLGDIAAPGRVQVFCVRSGRRYCFQWSILRTAPDTALLLLNAQNLTDHLETSRQSARSASGATETRLAALTRRERQVMDLVVAGKFNKSIADVLGISAKTVELHRASVMTKLGVRNLPDLVKVYFGYR